MMGNNQQFNSPAAPAHSQPPFKFDHHTPPAPLVPGPSPVQPGIRLTGKINCDWFCPGGTAMQTQQVTIPTHVGYF